MGLEEKLLLVQTKANPIFSQVAQQQAPVKIPLCEEKREMKTIGLLGGTSWPSTIEYYR